MGFVLLIHCYIIRRLAHALIDQVDIYWEQRTELLDKRKGYWEQRELAVRYKHEFEKLYKTIHPSADCYRDRFQANLWTEDDVKEIEGLP